jgi:hypothetical protein
VQRVGAGDHDVRVPVDDAGEIGLLQEGVNTMVAGLAERERLRDLFGRHVGTTVAQQAMVTGGSLGGELRTVAALFVDIAGSTSLMLRTGPDQLVGDPVNEAARLADLAKDVPGRVVASAEAVRDAGAGEERQWAPGVVAEFRGRHRPTRTWVPPPTDSCSALMESGRLTEPLSCAFLLRQAFDRTYDRTHEPRGADQHSGCRGAVCGVGVGSAGGGAGRGSGDLPADGGPGAGGGGLRRLPAGVGGPGPG